MKATAANDTSKADSKYVPLIQDSLQKFKELQKDMRRGREQTGRLRTSSRRLMNETWEILRRVETTL